MADFEPPPTYAEVVITDEKTGKERFNPIWLKWFVDIAALLTSAGGGGGGIVHNDTTGLQGGTANQYYHLSAAMAAAVAALGTMASQNANGVAITGGAIALSGRLQEKQGASFAAANNLTTGTDGNYFQVTGATQINLINSVGWQGGSMLRLKFNSTPTVKNNQGASTTFHPINLAGAVDFVASALDVLTLTYDSTDSCWYETARSVN